MRLWLLLTAVTAVVAKMPLLEKLEATEKMKMSPKEYKQVVKMHHNWYTQAVHGLLIAYAKKMYKTHSDDPHVRKAIVACLDGVTEENALKQTADCLTHLFDGTLISQMGDKMHGERYSFVEKLNETRISAESKDIAITKSSTDSTPSTPSTTTSTTTQPSTTSTSTLPSFVLAKKKHRKRYGKGPIRIKFRQLRKGRKHFDEEKRRVKRALSAFMGAKSDPPKRKLRDIHIEAKTENGYRRRMLDSVLGPDHPIKLPDMSDLTITKELRNILPNEYKSLVDMLQGIPGIDDKGRDRFLSPRFMPLFPSGDSRDNNSILSPEIMPMYRLPSLLETTGLLERERNSLLSLILESSGAMDVVDTAMDAIMKTKDMGLGEDVNRANKMIGNTFTEIKGILSPQQHAEMEEREFTHATSAQLKKLYGSQGKYNESTFPFDLVEYDKWSDEEKEQSLRNTIRILADRGEDDHPTSHRARYKRALGYPDIVFPNGYTIKFFSHTTLSPFYFSPSFSTLSVLGPVILSPSLFCPSFLTGLLFSPPVIAPQLANPLFLSPYVLGPDVMSAAMFNVYVLSPYFMSPNVINPYIASPLILSPFVMCPDVLSPTILSGAVLSPSVLSPQVFTKNAMSISALSPSFLS
ncbi:hypothetical protein PRIPAC_72490 [Pristionchus pacificus]|uniref:Uncharacterized protein n=1 Tax=Pristionchus pacificus TaxID=54126 RepID=A0A2A6C9X8_PRIPA|nr:hypothetical protein PRIPAC_72490 [Pristionchus pacificus]|eukprot:PDM74890.1 hypothetical protein PRIPAC_40271 [Pristionchus pacificus]